MDPRSFPPEFFQREDESNDAEFYTMPRLVVHIDDGAIDAVGKLFRRLIPEQAEVLDLMSSWRTHWPDDHPRKRIVGLGMNAAEMADNPQLTEYVLRDINADPSLPFDDESFDAVVITVSVQYPDPSAGCVLGGFQDTAAGWSICGFVFQPLLPHQGGEGVEGDQRRRPHRAGSIVYAPRRGIGWGAGRVVQR